MLILVGMLTRARVHPGTFYTIGGTSVSWMSNLQNCVSLSSTESEYVTIVEARKEMIWLEYYLEQLGKK